MKFCPAAPRSPQVPTRAVRRLDALFVRGLRDDVGEPFPKRLAVYAIGAVVVRTIGWFSVLFTGRWPVAMRDWLVRFPNYYYRVWAFVTMVHTEYPRFGTAPV